MPLGFAYNRLMESINLAHIARLARLHFSEEELHLFQAQVAEILNFVEQLKTVNVEGVEPTSHPLRLSDVFREDVPAAPLAIESFLKRSPLSRGRFFEVPKIIENA